MAFVSFSFVRACHTKTRGTIKQSYKHPDQQFILHTNTKIEKKNASPSNMKQLETNI